MHQAVDAAEIDAALALPMTVPALDAVRQAVQAQPDRTRIAWAVTAAEAAAIAELLGASIALSRLSSLSDKVPGLFTEEISLPLDSKFIGRPMGDTKARTLTSSSIVAISRGTEIIPSPTPDVPFEHGDVIIAVGTRKGLDLLSKIIDKGPS